MKQVILHGAGREAGAAAAYFLPQSVKPLLYDDGGGSIDGIESITLDQALRMVDGALYLRSPGVPPNNRLAKEAATRAALATTPTGYWLREHAPQNTITVTGTKGKSTTTTLLTLILQKAGLASQAYGNIGAPPLGPEPVTATHPVVEVSSYMMHDLPETDHLHLITSLFKEHTDWHGSEAAYRAAKLRPFLRTNPAPGIAPRALIEKEALPESVHAAEDIIKDQAESFLIGTNTVDLGPRERGFHTGPLRSAMHLALAAASRFVTAPPLSRAAADASLDWRGLPSRQEIIPTTDGRLWVDDALATIPEATIAALDRFRDKEVRLILGGADRGQDFSRLNQSLADTLPHRAYVYGPVAERLATGKADVCEDFDEAITQAQIACPIDGVVLFSPAAPSSPPHKNFSERSHAFRAHIKTL